MRKVGPLAYWLKLPTRLSRILDTFHVSMLRKYIPDPSHVLREQPVQLKENLTYEETPVQILDRKEQVLRSKVIDSCHGRLSGINNICILSSSYCRSQAIVA